MQSSVKPAPTSYQWPDGGGENDVCMWWPNTIDRRFWSMAWFGRIFSGSVCPRSAVVDDFGNLVAVR